jgi:dethiobiotin synthetase
LHGLFVTGTDTGVGKTVLAGAIVAALRESGTRVAAFKPIITGLDEPPHDDWPPDHELLAAAAGLSADDVALMRFGPPVSPHLAAELSGATIDPQWIARTVAERAADADVVIVEGVGGLLVPLSDSDDVRVLALALGLPLVIAARPGLGTINHTLLTLEAARACDLPVAGVVLTPWPDAPDAIERSNRDTIGRLGDVEVGVLPRIARAERGLLADAARSLPLEHWLEVASVT